jgi:hypothetical protein
MAPAMNNANRNKVKVKQPSSKISQRLCNREAVQRTYRFNAELWAEFEVDCKLNLRNPRLVVEAMVRYWLDAGPKTSEFIAWHQQKCADGRFSKPPVSTTRSAAPQPNSADTGPFEDRDYRDFGDVLDV